MNRILQADVILTLTREQALAVLQLLWERAHRGHDPEFCAQCSAALVVKQQCGKQGVRQ